MHFDSTLLTANQQVAKVPEMWEDVLKGLIWRADIASSRHRTGVADYGKVIGHTGQIMSFQRKSSTGRVRHVMHGTSTGTHTKLHPVIEYKEVN